MKLLTVVLVAAVLKLATSSLLDNDRQGSAQTVIAARTIDDAAHDEILNSINVEDIRKYFSKSDEMVRVHSPRILLKIISKGNNNAYEALMSLNADPFKKHEEYGMSAWDFISVIPREELRDGQVLIKADLEKRYKNIYCKRQIDSNTLMNDQTLMYFPRFTDFETYKSIVMARGKSDSVSLALIDGSYPIHQAIIGNNYDFLDKLVKVAATEVNRRWENKGVRTDIQNYRTINPIGWTPLMLAIEFNRVEMVRVLLEVSGVDLNAKVADFDAIDVARFLPVSLRETMLDLLKKKFKNSTVTVSGQIVDDFQRAIEGGASVAVLEQFLRKEKVDLNVLKSAVSHLTDENILIKILREAETILMTDPSIHKILWSALKLDKRTKTADGFKKKIKHLIDFGFKFDERRYHVTAEGGMTPLEEAYKNVNLDPELALGIVKCSKQVKTLEANEKAPIVLAIENQRVNIAKYLLENAVDLDLDYEMDCNEEKENLMHYAISWIESESDLKEILDLLLTLNPEFLNKQSVSIVKNDVSYDLDGKVVKYNVLKRAKWTPLMYAVLLRKNEVARHLITRGADRRIKGWDGVDVDEIIQIRCEAYKKATTAKASVVIDERKKRYNEKARIRIINAIKKELDNKYAYQ